MGSGAVVVSDYWSYAYGITEKNSDKYKINVHHYSIGGDPILSRKFHQLEIIDHCNKGDGNIAHQFRRAVNTCFKKDAAVISEFCEAQNSSLSFVK